MIAGLQADERAHRQALAGGNMNERAHRQGRQARTGGGGYRPIHIDYLEKYIYNLKPLYSFNRIL